MNKLTESASIFGVLAQLGERYAGSVEVRGSNPLRSTMIEMLSALYKALSLLTKRQFFRKRLSLFLVLSFFLSCFCL